MGSEMCIRDRSSGGDCSDRPDQNVSDPDRLMCLSYIFAAAIFLRRSGGEIKLLSFCQSTHLVDFHLFRAATVVSDIAGHEI